MAAMARWRRANAELEALQAFAALVQGSVLGDTGESFSLAASLARVAEEIENWINTAAANGFWGLDLLWLMSYRIFLNWNLSWSCSVLGGM
jgi:hypothetical protein